jgi:serine/threonine protein kinase
MFVCPECGAAQMQAGACPADGNPLAPRGEDVLIGTTVGAYRIARLLGVGGMGRVYKGVHPQIGSRVAIKVLSRECADRKDLVDRFFSEARAVNLIRHESIVNVLDLATLPDGRPFIVMEYLDGAPLADLISRMGASLPLGGLARLATEVLDALGAAHGKGIVHRDLKPDNVFVAPSGRPKVLDFGIAKLLPELGGSYTQTGSLLGTPHYMAPEQALGKPVDHRTDIYSMGVIVYECATGRRPFNADSLFDLLRKHVDEPPLPPRQLRPDLPPAMESVILTAMAKDPNQRFPSAVAMAQALMASAQGLPSQAWAAVSPATAGIGVPGSPSGAGWGSGASWQPSPMPQSPVPPTPHPHAHSHTPPSPMGHLPTAHVAGLQAAMGQQRMHPDQLSTHPMGGHGQPPYTPPAAHMPPMPHQGTPTTATAGQVLGGAPAKPKSGGGKGVLFAVLGLVLVGGGIAAGVLLTRKDDDATPVAAGSGSGSAVAIADTDTAGDDGDSQVEADDPDPDPDLGDIPDMGDQPMFDKATLEQIKQLDPETKKTMLSQIRAARSQMEANMGLYDGATKKQVQKVLDEYKKVEDALGGGGGGGGGGTAKAQGGTTTAPDPDPDPDPDPTPQPTDKIENRDLPMPSGFNAKKFDPSSYAKTALEWAKKNVDPDAKLFRIDADGVMPDGNADLTLDSNYMVDYRFISPARAKRPDNIPLGVKYEYQCMFRIWVTKDSVQLREMSGWECKEKTLPLPKCSTAEVWKTAISKGAPDKNAVGQLGYRADFNGRAMWYFDIDGVFDDMWTDGC